jgi:hypothetical protein
MPLDYPDMDLSSPLPNKNTGDSPLGIVYTRTHNIVKKFL